METKHIDIAKIKQNTGQVPGLPTNPRTWTKAELSQLKRSLKDTPELFEARGIIVYPHEGEYIVMGGNMRLAASLALNLKEVPCIVLPESTPVDKLKEIVVKDNGAFGNWDFDLLANEWDDLPLTDWGVPAWDTDAADEAMPENLDAEPVAKPFAVKLTFPDAASETRFVTEYKSTLEKEYGCMISQSG